MNIAVVGAGPAGMIVATLLALRGETVSLIDEQSGPGGHLTYDAYAVPGSETQTGEWLAELRSALAASNVKVLCSAVAWAAFRIGDQIELAVNHAGGEQSLTVDQLVVAAGTTDLPLIVPGATLPGVLTSRAVRILLNRHGVIPARRFIVVGETVDAGRLKIDLESAGCEVVRVLPPGQIGAIAGDAAVQGVRSSDGDLFAADAVVLACGEAPDLQLAGMLEAARRYDPALSGWRLALDGGLANVHAVGGALLGAADVPELVRSAVEVANRICQAGPSLSESGLALSQKFLQMEAARK
jgi:sarcosine oxidase subunit alpha